MVEVSTNENSLKAQIAAEKAEIEVLEKQIADLRSSFQHDAALLKSQMTEQHEVLRKIIRYANKLEEQLKDLKQNVHYMKNLHKTSMH